MCGLPEYSDGRPEDPSRVAVHAHVWVARSPGCSRSTPTWSQFTRMCGLPVKKPPRGHLGAVAIYAHVWVASSNTIKQLKKGASRNSRACVNCGRLFYKKISAASVRTDGRRFVFSVPDRAQAQGCPLRFSCPRSTLPTRPGSSRRWPACRFGRWAALTAAAFPSGRL